MTHEIHVDGTSHSLILIPDSATDKAAIEEMCEAISQGRRVVIEKKFGRMSISVETYKGKDGTKNGTNNIYQR